MQGNFQVGRAQGSRSTGKMELGKMPLSSDVTRVALEGIARLSGYEGWELGLGHPYSRGEASGARR